MISQPLDLDDLKRWCDLATPGPWCITGYQGRDGKGSGRLLIGVGDDPAAAALFITAHGELDADASFVTIARLTMPRLIGERARSGTCRERSIA